MGLKPKNKSHANFYQCCDLTKKVYLAYTIYIFFKQFHETWLDYSTQGYYNLIIFH